MSRLYKLGIYTIRFIVGGLIVGLTYLLFALIAYYYMKTDAKVTYYDLYIMLAAGMIAGIIATAIHDEIMNVIFPNR